MTSKPETTPDPFLCTDYNPAGDWCQRTGRCTCAELERLRAALAEIAEYRVGNAVPASMARRALHAK
jgi:hypothetical protein